MTLILIFNFTTHNGKLQTASLTTVTSTCEEYKDTLISAIKKHSFLAKCQADFLTAKKESLEANEVIVLGISLKIISSLCKMKSKVIFGVKNTTQYTHSLYIYFIDGDGNIPYNSLCFISDDNNDNKNSVYKVQAILVDYLKEYLPVVDKIFYFSDDCAEQYKNCKNLINLYHHQQDFSMDAE